MGGKLRRTIDSVLSAAAAASALNAVGEEQKALKELKEIRDIIYNHLRKPKIENFENRVYFKKGDGNTRLVYKGREQVGSYWFRREWFDGHPVTSGVLTIIATEEEINLASIAYAKDARRFVLDYFSNK